MHASVYTFVCSLSHRRTDQFFQRAWGLSNLSKKIFRQRPKKICSSNLTEQHAINELKLITL